MANTVKIIPAILTDDARTLEKMIRQAEKFTDYVQIDIMDGKFVPSRSVTWEQIAPLKARLAWEVHLMVERPETQLENFLEAGAKKAIFHFEAVSSPAQVISTARKLGLQVGLAINPETPVGRIKQFAGELDSVLFLSVHPGFYGAEFIPETLDGIAELHLARPELVAAIDGGIKESNISQVAKSGVNEICVGSAIFLQPDPAEAYRKLIEIVN
jgi:ribulose-phosphate 3-epimerase